MRAGRPSLSENNTYAPIAAREAERFRGAAAAGNSDIVLF
jgi:hypothetical protein